MPPSPAGAQPMLAPAPLSVGSFIKVGWETFKKRPWFFIFALIIFGLASGIVNILGGIIQGLLDGSADSGIGHLISWFISNVGSIFVGIGTLSFFIKAHDTPETVTYHDAWRPELFWKYLGAYLLYIIIVMVGFVLLIIPGIIASLAFGMTMYLVVDKGMGPIEALKESARITKGNRWRLFAFGGASVLLSLLGILCLIVGIFVAAPVLALAGVEAYRRISAAADAHAPTPLTGGEKALVGVGFLLPIIAIVGIIAAIVLASIGVAREKGKAAYNETNLRMIAMEVELYFNENNQYPADLAEVTSQLSPNSQIDVAGLTYTTDAEHATYKLCSTAPVREGQDACISSEDVPSTTAE